MINLVWGIIFSCVAILAVGLIWIEVWRDHKYGRRHGKD